MDNKVKLHLLKLREEYLYDILSGVKKAELRNNDRNFQVGDLIHFTDVDGYEFVNTQLNMPLASFWRITNIVDVSEVVPNVHHGDYVMLSIDRISSYTGH